MNKLIFLVLIFVATVVASPTPMKKEKLSKSSLLAQARQISLFLPYWNLPKKNTPLKTPSIASLNKINSVRPIYFGITANKQGINKHESGYQNLKKITTNQDSLLTLRLTNQDLTQEMLEDPKLQTKIINETAIIARDYEFSGLLLDLELSSLPTQQLINQINNFVFKLSNRLTSFNLTLTMTLYGDQFYRPRPYDVRFLNKYVDKFFIMAYNFHKIYGSPGPNFPLAKGQRFNYDLQTAIHDFTSIIPAEKLTFVFGMYGYDWTVDEQQRPIKAASSLTLNQIKKKFLQNCSFNSCVIKRDRLAQETEISYTENPNRFHKIWFEDEISVAKKIEFLKSKNIVSYAFWAYGYY